MTIKEMEDKVDLLKLIEEDFATQPAGSNALRVNPCPVCGKMDHFTVYPETNSFSSFNGCCKGGGSYQYLREVRGMNNEEAIEKLKETSCKKENKKEKPNQKTAKSEIKSIEYKDHTNFIEQLHENMKKVDRGYFTNRGIGEGLIDKYKLSVWDLGDGKRAIFPIWIDGKVAAYTGRALEGQEPKYRNSRGAAPLFNIDYINEKHEENIFITEGIVDALTLESLGFKAISLGGTQHASKLIDAIKETPGALDNKYLTVFDNDKAGETAKDKSPFKPISIPKEYKDINEWYLGDSRAIRNNIENQIELLKRPDAVIKYLEEAFVTDIEKYKSFKDKKTGFSNLDQIMNGLYAGLYVVGGISSVGKTTFVHQLGDQLAEQGEHVIYFSLEQSKFEMVSKSLSRLTAKQNYNTAVSALSIRCGNIKQEVINAAEKYEKTAKKVNIVEGNFNTSVNRIRNYVEDYITANNVKPIVIVDYLQIVPATEETKFSDKQKIDYNVTELKRISRDNDIAIFVVSSLNRGNYLAPIDFESFKESGGIEYTADVIWGLQLQEIHNPIFDSNNNIMGKREAIRLAKAANPRKIELVCLKNRNGISSYSCGFIYYPKFDLYVSESIRG